MLGEMANKTIVALRYARPEELAGSSVASVRKLRGEAIAQVPGYYTHP
jgi:hypothetical protein